MHGWITQGCERCSYSSSPDQTFISSWIRSSFAVIGSKSTVIANTSSAMKTTTKPESTMTAITVPYSKSKPHTTFTASYIAESHTPRTQSNGLNTGAAIGIGIAIAVVAIALICILGFICYRRLRRSKSSAAQYQHNTGHDARSECLTEVTEVTEVDKGGTVVTPYELSGTAIAGELETSANRHELDPRDRKGPTLELPAESGKRKPFDYVRSSWYSASSVEDLPGYGCSAV